MNKKTASFRENIRNSFITYAIVPTLVLACLGLAVFFGSWTYSIVHYNRADNQYVLEKIQGIAKDCEEEIDILLDIIGQNSCDKIEINNHIISEFYEEIYKINWQNTCDNQVYILNQKGSLVWNVKDGSMDFITRPEYFNWGILRKIRQQPSEVSTCLQNGFWCFGKGIVDDRGELLGYIVAGIDTARCKELFSGISRQYAVADDMGWIYISNSEDLSDDFGRFIWFDDVGEGFVRYNSRHFYLIRSHIKDAGLWIYTITDTDPETPVMKWMVLMIAAIFGIIGVITFYSTQKVSLKYTQDVNAIANAFTRVENGDWDTQLQIDSTLEFQKIGKAFNKMIYSMKRQLEENKELALHAAFAQVKQLESQFNPHFLFNTLDNIRFMTKIDTQAADKMITSLSKLLRYSIHDSGEEISVKEDIENMQSYFNILQIRYNKRFAYHIDIEEKILDCMIPKLIVQPLIENAVKYGFAGREKLTVRIKGYELADRLFFSCEDDGVGMDEEQLQAIRLRLQQKENKEGHLGLYNIHRRIQLMYGDTYGIYIESKDKQGVIVVLVLPVKRKMGEEQ